MTRQEALTLFGLPDSADAELIRQTLDSRLADLDARIAQATSDSLRDKFVQNRELLRQAGQTLQGSGAIDLGALPIAERHARQGGGRTLGDYRLLDTLGSTPDATTFNAERVSDGSSVILVRIDRRLTRPEQRQLDQELSEMSRIHAPGVQALLDYQLGDEGPSFLTLAPIQGQPLQARLSSLDASQRQALVFRLCETVDEMHRFRPHGAIDSQSVWIDGDQPRLCRLAMTGLQLHPGSRAYSQRAPSREHDLQSLGVVIAQLFVPDCDPAADLVSCTARLPAPLRKVFSDLVSGDRRKRPDSAAELANRLRQALSPAPVRWLRTPALRYAALPAVLLAVALSLFHEQITEATGKLWMSAAEKAQLQDEVLQGLTEAENLLAGHERSLDKLGQEIERLQRQLDEIRMTGKGKAQLIPGLTESLLHKQDVLDRAEAVIARTELAALKGEIAVIKQRLSAQQLTEAKTALQQLLPRVHAVNNLIPTLEELAATDDRIRKARKQLDGAPLTAAQQAEVEQLAQRQAQLLDAQQPQAALAEGAKPLLQLYTQEIAAREQQHQDDAAAALARLVKEIRKDLVQLPPGTFQMGYRNAGAFDARPIHKVRTGSFSISRYPVTNALFHRYEQHRGQGRHPNNRLPATDIDWSQAQDFTRWIGKTIGMHCRLPSEAEWEYAARSGLSGDFPWGQGMPAGKANCAGCGGDGGLGATEVGSYPANQHGLFDMYGNVWEWVQDCYVDSYRDAPGDGSAVEFDGCKRHVLRGGAWNSSVREVHPGFRNAANQDFSSDTIGFRFVCL